MLTFTSLSSPSRSAAILSRIGETAWHGPHHSAQKSTRTGLSLLRTSCSKSVVFTAVAIDSFRRSGASYPPRNGSEPRKIPAVQPPVRESGQWRVLGEPGGSPSRPTLRGMFAPLPDKPDHPALEEEVLAWWESEGIFDRLREQNRGGPKFSFIDGPVTANKSLAVHTAWGRTLKDVFQRYKALRGFDQRYQNGFDCQGLWIEVGVERELGLNSKREIEEYGLERFAAKCREVVVRSADDLTRGCKRLGQWMDWGNDYFTFSDTNIEYIWRFLKLVHEREWLYTGHRSTEWCPRCGTSLSQHELTQSGVYQEKSDPSLYVRFPLLDRDNESV